MKIQSSSIGSPALVAIRLQSQPQISATQVQGSADEVSISATAQALSNFSEKTLPSDNFVKEIMTRYSLRNISYTNLVKMANELKASGALQEKDYLDFIGPSPEFASVSGQRVADWDKAQDHIDMQEQQISFMQSNGFEQRFIDFAKYRLNLLQHFQSLKL